MQRPQVVSGRTSHIRATPTGDRDRRIHSDAEAAPLRYRLL